MPVQMESLKTLYESHGAVATCRAVAESIKDGDLKPDDFSLKGLALTFCGESWYESLRPDAHGGYKPIGLLESDAVDTSAFTNILGQVITAQILKSYDEVGEEVDPLIRVEDSKFSSEKIYGMTPILGEVGDHVVHEGERYPEYGFGEDWIQTPETEKRGGIVSVTRELIFFDRTGLALRRAKTVGTELGYNKRLRWIDVMIGFVNNYNRQGTVLNTYLATGAWINKKTGVELIDWSDIDELEALSGDMLEPYNDRPINIAPATHMIVMPPKKATARRLLAAGSLEIATNSANTKQTVANPYSGDYQLVVSKLIYQREKLRNPTNAGTRWYLGNPRAAFAYYQNWAIGVRTQGLNSEASFERDIEIRYRADERGIAGVEDPTAMFQGNLA